ncbi:tRNA (adenine(22)-N(1))-methyltransferase TrmK [Streptococcus merionis]|uniref:tRNA (adenine(22)-N(1))-methyltransferase n=1 Tax=Streptococcus merionis TaxID=400065 RepID=UPI0026F17A64|nr:tRNA (adenine(22)-N(1))-methyltransferase TrmK [Streptococcus merionis]
MEELSRRLKTVVSFVPQGARLLDVGSDHAYLPLYLMAKGQISFAIAGEVVAGPYQSALAHVSRSAFAKSIEVRLADGLSAMTPADEIDTIVIAGMGGRLISRILGNGCAGLEQVRRLILQPNNSEDEVRSWLQQNGYALIAEAILEESGKFYEILVAEAGQQELSDKELRFGPFLSQEKSDVFQARWLKENLKLEQALSQIPDSKVSQRQVLEERILAIKEVLDESE